MSTLVTEQLRDGDGNPLDTKDVIIWNPVESRLETTDGREILFDGEAPTITIITNTA